VSKTDRDGRTTSFAYDSGGCETNEYWLNSSGGIIRSITYTYDAADEMTGASDPSATLTFTYDSGGRLISAATSGPSGGQPAVALSYTYDNVGNRTCLTDNITSANGQGVISYAYDAAYRLMWGAFKDSLGAGLGNVGTGLRNAAVGMVHDFWANPVDLFFGTNYSYSGQTSQQDLQDGEPWHLVSGEMALNMLTGGGLNYVETMLDPSSTEADVQQAAGGFLGGAGALYAGSKVLGPRARNGPADASPPAAPADPGAFPVRVFDEASGYQAQFRPFDEPLGQVQFRPFDQPPGFAIPGGSAATAAVTAEAEAAAAEGFRGAATGLETSGGVFGGRSTGAGGGPLDPEVQAVMDSVPAASPAVALS
jgi:YD repeat-containing protein